MNQKERSLIVLRALILDSKPEEPTYIEKTYILDKIGICLELIRPEVLLSPKGLKIFEKEVEKLRKSGKII